jgi:hypothetical protein
MYFNSHVEWSEIWDLGRSPKVKNDLTNNCLNKWIAT